MSTLTSIPCFLRYMVGHLPQLPHLQMLQKYGHA